MSSVTRERFSPLAPFFIRSRLGLAVVALLIVASVLAEGTLGPTRRYRTPPGWELHLLSVGVQTYADEKTHVLPVADVVSEYERSLTLIPPWRPDTVIVEDRLTIRDVATGEITWEYATQLPVDPNTGAHLSPAYRGEIQVFPHDVQKIEYRLRSNYVPGLPLHFQRVDTVGGIETWVFAYHGALRGDYYTESFAGTARFPGVAVPAGQEIRCADDQFTLRMWVEPQTGAPVKTEEACPSGDYLFDSSGVARGAVDRWSGVTSGEGLGQRIATVRTFRRRYLLAKHLSPALAMSALLFLVGSVRVARTAPED